MHVAAARTVLHMFHTFIAQGQCVSQPVYTRATGRTDCFTVATVLIDYRIDGRPLVYISLSVSLQRKHFNSSVIVIILWECVLSFIFLCLLQPGVMLFSIHTLVSLLGTLR